MGNENSRSGKNASRIRGRQASPTRSEGSGVSSSFSFLSRKRNSTKSTSSIVVVSNATFADPSEDEDLKRLNELPRILPILRDVLPHHLPSPSICSKVDSHHINGFFQTIRNQCSFYSHSVSSDQGRILTGIEQSDQLISALLRQVEKKAKRFEQLDLEMKEIQALDAKLEDTRTLLNNLISTVKNLNEHLPAQHRLLPLSLQSIEFQSDNNSRKSSFDRNAVESDNNTVCSDLDYSEKLVSVEELKVVDI